MKLIILSLALTTVGAQQTFKDRRRDAFDLCQAKADAYAACDPDQEATENFADDGDDNGAWRRPVAVLRFYAIDARRLRCLME